MQSRAVWRRRRAAQRFVPSFLPLPSLTRAHRFVVVVKSHVYVNTGKVFVRDCLSGVGDMIEMDIKQLAAFVKGGGGGWESGNPNRTVSEHAAGGSGGDVMAIGGGR